MRLLIFVPEQSAATGNLITAARLQTGLAGQGITAAVAQIPDNDPHSAYRQACHEFEPDVVLLLHAWRTGRAWLADFAEQPLPAAVLLTGTDIHGGIDDPQQGPTIRAVLDAAGLILSQNRLSVAELQQSSWRDKIHWLPPAVELGNEPYPLRANHSIPADAVLFLHPAGIRPVKANLELLHLCDPLAARHKTFRLAFCGPVLDHDYAERFFAALAGRPWAAWLGVIPPAAMAAALSEADVVLNHSCSEGLTGALLEALAVGRAILARNIPGNAAIIDHGNNGLLYDRDERFLELAEALLSDAALRQRLAAARRPVLSPQHEAAVLSALLRQLL